MRIAYTTTFDTSDVHNWSGTPRHMAQSLEKTGMDVTYIGNLKRQLPAFFKVKQVMNKWLSDQRESPRFNVVAAKHYSQQVANKLKNTMVDAVVSPLINPIAYLDCKQPLVLWTDAVYASLVAFYPPFIHHSAATIKQGNAMTAECLSRCNLAIFSSDWAAQAAINFYGAKKEKVKVVPFGANIESYPTLEEIKKNIAQRDQTTIKLLFLAKSWERKGGDIVLAVAKALHEAGHSVELSIVGYTPNLDHIPSYVRCLGFISKHSLDGKEKLKHLFSETHFLFVPSRAEAYGIVFCEANAYGVPCLTTYVGGISTIVKDHVNGMKFSLNATPSDYCEYIVNTLRDRNQYETLALSSYNEFITRLNWNAASQQVKSLIEGIV